MKSPLKQPVTPKITSTSTVIRSKLNEYIPNHQLDGTNMYISCNNRQRVMKYDEDDPMEVYKYQTDAVKYVRDVITPKIGQNKPRETASRKNHWQSKEDDEKVVRGHSCAQVDLGDYEHKIEQVCLQNNMKEECTPVKVAFDQSDGHHYRPISQNVRQYQVSRSPQPILCEGYRKPYNNYEEMVQPVDWQNCDTRWPSPHQRNNIRSPERPRIAVDTDYELNKLYDVTGQLKREADRLAELNRRKMQNSIAAEMNYIDDNSMDEKLRKDIERVKLKNAELENEKLREQLKRQQQGQGSTSLLDNDGGKRSGIVQQTINKETFRSQFRAFMRKKPKFHYSMDPNTDSEFSDFELEE